VNINKLPVTNLHFLCTLCQFCTFFLLAWSCSWCCQKPFSLIITAL